MYVFIAIISLAILWSVWGHFSSNVEQASYSVVRIADTYEVRDYPAHIVAQTKVDGSYNEALNEGFSIVAGYIFGGNAKKESIAMTAPVTAQKQGSETIAMTAPVTTSTEENGRVVSFVMPQKYTLESLPIPTDPRVKIVTVPRKKMAVLRFSWFRNSERIKEKEIQLLTALAEDKVEIIGTPSYAGYNAPWTPPWMMRNEVLVEIK